MKLTVVNQQLLLECYKIVDVQSEYKIVSISKTLIFLYTFYYKTRFEKCLERRRKIV